MTQSSTLLAQAREHIGFIQQSLRDALAALFEQGRKLEQDFKKSEGTERFTIHTLLQYTKKRQFEMDALIPSPYFSRCDLVDEGKKSELYIGKFSYPEHSIVSWVSPVSTVRFAHPGRASFTTPQRLKKEVDLLRKDEYMITDGVIKFFAMETVEQPRVLVFQDHFSNRKTGFLLPEIVSRMEEAQDRIIRSSWRGPLVISGPAGSGKTTLALHRVGYLMQVPEIQDHFPAHRIRVFVQDEGTRSYFGRLLPELGIDNVEITTFYRWAHDILDIPVATAQEISIPESVFDAITLQKLALVHSCKERLLGSPRAFLQALYQKNFTQHGERVLEMVERGEFDDLDLTILLLAYKRNHGTLHESREYLVQQKNTFEVKRKMGRFAVSYNLCVVDEFQNYIPEQLQLIRSCMNEETQSIVYVGDMRQQTRFGTIQDWTQIGETIDSARFIILEKVYRNTQEILKYIQSKGYDIAIPEALPVGTPVQELPNTIDTESYIRSLATSQTDRLIGILAKDSKHLIPYAELKNCTHIKVLTLKEAQGVEFDTVFLVGNTPSTWRVSSAYFSPERKQEKEKINRDLLYVGLTRAMRELYVVGPLDF